MLTEIQQLATLAATGTGIWVASNGLGTWKRELTGKRDLELCQAVIERLYEAEDRMAALRSPISFASEGETHRPPVDGEHPDEKHKLDVAFVPLARLAEQSEFWTTLFAYRWRMRAAFGDGAVVAFDQIEGALRQFRASAITRYNLLAHSTEAPQDLMRKVEADIWFGAKPDAIADKMRAAIESMEAICIPIIRQRRRDWRGWFRGEREAQPDEKRKTERVV